MLHSLVSRYQFPTELLSSDGTLISKRIDQSDTCTEIEHVLVDYYCRLTEKIQTSCQISKIVYLAKAYIEEHYASEDISLKEIAATVFATPAYVSSLFKKETGNSIIEYITICRMRRAACLLYTSSLPRPSPHRRGLFCCRIPPVALISEPKKIGRAHV